MIMWDRSDVQDSEHHTLALIDNKHTGGEFITGKIQ